MQVYVMPPLDPKEATLEEIELSKQEEYEKQGAYFSFERKH